MNLISSIEEFKKEYRDNKFFWIIDIKCSMDVLEYYINNYSGILWSGISRYQPLTETFIDKYKDKLDWNVIFSNRNIKLTYDFLEKHLYQYNLYVVNVNEEYEDIFTELSKTYLVKYNIDKLEYELNK